MTCSLAILKWRDLLPDVYKRQVLVRELADADALDILEHAHSLLESAHLVRRQVDLRHVAGDRCV